MTTISRRFIGLSGAAATLLALLPTARAQATAETPKKNRLVVQVSDNDPAKWNLALNNVSNVQADLASPTA